MGIYVNPRDMSKEQWLSKHGTPIPPPDQHRIGDNIAVCHVYNGDFTAVGVAYSQNELEAFKYPDPRVKFWYTVPLNELINVGAIVDASSIRE